jgi:hypothetical protein
MKTAKFSEWVTETHPEFAVDEGLFTTRAEDRLSDVMSRTRRDIRNNPAPRAISPERSIQGIATEFMAAVDDAVKAQQATTDEVQKAALAVAGSYLSPRAAVRLFLTAATRSGQNSLEAVSKELLSMTKAGSKMQLNDPTIQGTRNLYRAIKELEIGESDRVKIRTLLNAFLNRLVGPGSGPTSTPNVRA